MTRSSRIDRAGLYNTITGRGEVETEAAMPAPQEPNIVNPATVEVSIKKQKKSSVADEECTPKTYRITEKQYKAIMIKRAMSNSPTYDSQSAVVRAALDAYLADILETL